MCLLTKQYFLVCVHARVNVRCAPDCVIIASAYGWRAREEERHFRSVYCAGVCARARSPRRRCACVSTPGDLGTASDCPSPIPPPFPATGSVFAVKGVVRVHCTFLPCSLRVPSTDNPKGWVHDAFVLKRQTLFALLFSFQECMTVARSNGVFSVEYVSTCVCVRISALEFSKRTSCWNRL